MSTWCAAVAAAIAALTIARLTGASGGNCPRPGGVAPLAFWIALIALTFHSRTMSVGSAAAAEAAGISVVAASTTIAMGIESHRALGGRGGCVIARPSGVVARAEVARGGPIPG